jgi:hypothetical protein
VGFFSAAGGGTGLATFEGGSASRTSGPTAKSTRIIISSPGVQIFKAAVVLFVGRRFVRIFFLLAPGSVKFLAAHRLLFMRWFYHENYVYGAS